MVLTSAAEDFEGKTLNAIPGLLGKLRYVTVSRDKGGVYSHWGLEKVYGASSAERAIRSSHCSLMAKILKTPLQELTTDLQRSSEGAQMATVELLSSLEKPAANAPLEMSAGALQRHFRSVLHTLSALVEHSPPATSQSELLLRPPVQ